MVSKESSKIVLTIGCNYQTTKGGISTVIGSYSKIFAPFNFVATTQTKTKISNLIYLIYSLIRFTSKCCFGTIGIIHIHTASNSSFWRKSIYINIAKLFGKKVVLHIHGGMFNQFYENNKEKVKKVLNKVDTIIALSKYWKNYFEETVGCKNVVIIPNIVENPNKIPNNKKNTIDAVFLGTINDNKGVFDILETVKRNREYFSQRITIHIGGIGEVERLKQFIDENDLSDIIKYEGWVDEKKKANLMSLCDIFLLPSYIEGLPISILEAMTYKMATISTNVGGIPEIIEDGINGFLIEPGNIKQLFDAIKSLVEDVNIRTTMGEESYRRVTPHLPENVAASLEKLYNNL